MTVFDYIPNYEGYSDRYSKWCNMVSACLDEYEALSGSYKYPGKIYCEWPITDKKMFLDYKKWGSFKTRGYSTFEEYRDRNNMVEFEVDFDQFISNIRNTDGTLDCAFQNERYLCYVHIGDSKHFSELGFGCIIDKFNNDIHYIALMEDDGNYWGDYDITENDLSGYEVSLISSVVNHLPSSCFWDKDGIMDKLWEISKKC